MLSASFASARRNPITLLLLLGSLTWNGCQPQQAPAPSATQPPAEKAPAAAGTNGPAGTPAPAGPQRPPVNLASDTWRVHLAQGDRVGYSHVVVKPITENGRSLLRITSESSLAFTRFGEKNKTRFEMETTETLDGQVLALRTLTQLGPTPVEVTGRWNPETGKLQLVSQLGDRQQQAELNLPDGCRGFLAQELALRTHPLAAGESLSYPALVPIANQVAQVKLIARGVEPTKLLDGQMHNLQRIDCLTTMPDGNEIVSTLWTNDQGEVLKDRTDTLQQETYLAPREVALSDAPAPKFDLGVDALVRVDKRVPNAHATRRVRYRVELAGSEPAEVFSKSIGQQIEPVKEGIADITVQAVRPDVPAEAQDPTRPPTAADRFPNSLVQSDAPSIIALADEIAPGETDGWVIAQAMEKWVHKNLTNKNFSQAFATAAEVAESREGDCTEHAVLLAALLRARGIPARVAIGLVYVENRQAFGYHMWTEAYIGDRWIPLDATLGRGGIGGGHLKLLATSLEGASAFSSFLPVAQIMGRLKISVLDVQ